ncbi:GspH/FimT family pseudopilin [Rhodanobacter sp. C01]|uniref:GspH/FimT family pseudopilin n=1 Tax=Rhodanobacter sp. C01 TaxID=1945856 RepID=UPI00098695B0|nr:GspH/FimT family pseudopilin [Rhodanobacter sp. C01]
MRNHRNGGSSGKQLGVTLIEQIMVLAIMAALTSIAAPPLRQLLSRNQLQVAQTDFIAALQHTRGTAITTGRRTLFCPSRDGQRCSEETRWDGGWLIGHDVDHDNQPDNGPLRTGRGYDKISILGDSGRRLVRFQSDGTAVGTTNTWRFCRQGQPDQALVVVLSNSGRIRGAPASAAQAADCAQTK